MAKFKEGSVTESTLIKWRQIIDIWFSNGFNGQLAYKQSYPNVTDNNAAVTFSNLKVYSVMKEYIKEKHKEAARFIEVTHEGVLAELKRWIESDITETISLSPEEIKELPIQLRRLITKYKVTERDIYGKHGDVIETVKTVELQFISKEKAIEMINKHIGFYEKDNKQKIADINYEDLDGETLKKIWGARKRD